MGGFLHLSMWVRQCADLDMAVQPREKRDRKEEQFAALHRLIDNLWGNSSKHGVPRLSSSSALRRGADIPSTLF